jgi:hypothetical protein
VNPEATREALKQAREAAVITAKRIHRRVSPQRGMPAVQMPETPASAFKPVILPPPPKDEK